MLRSVLLLGALLAGAAACTTTTRTVVPGPAANVAPTLVIEQFLRAVNANDLDTMGRLFGTREGPIDERDTRQQVDDRMFALASVLRHRDYSFEGEQLVPGRRDVATQLLVRMVLDDEQTAVVPFTMVYSVDRQWLVEQIGLERITNLR
jgi:hypothetical protein